MSLVELCWNITSYISIIVQLAAAGICLGIFVSPYMLGRSKAVKTGTVYGVVMTVLYIMPPRIDNILAYFIGSLAAFAVMCAEDRAISIKKYSYPSRSFRCAGCLLLWWESLIFFSILCF